MGDGSMVSITQPKLIKYTQWISTFACRVFIAVQLITIASLPVHAHATPLMSNRLIALKAPDVPLNSPLLDSFRNDSGQRSAHRSLLRSHHWPIQNRLYNVEPQHGIQDPRGFGPSLKSPYTVDPNGPNGPGMPGGSPLY
jgi:hypothetical protein